MTYGRELRIRRARQGFTQADLANLLGVTASYISKVENDKQLPSHFAGKRLQDILSLPEATAEFLPLSVKEPSARQTRLPLLALNEDWDTDESILPQETILEAEYPTVAYWDISQTIPKLSYLTHNYFRYFGKFPPSIPRRLLMDYQVSPNGAVLDIFCGCGTTSVEAKLANVHSIGIDSNPFGILAGRVKTRVLEVPKLEATLERIISRFDVSTRKSRANDRRTPEKSTKWFSTEVTNDLSKLKAAILRQPLDEYREFFALAFLAVVRRVSRAYDGEVRPHINCEKRPRAARDAFVKKSLDMMDRMRKFSELASHDAASTMIYGDNRKLPALLAGVKRRIELIVTHPPYLNCFDYIPVYKLEFMWADGFEELGERSTYDEAKEMEIRSWPAAKESFINEYFDNLRKSFGLAWQVLSPKGLCCVVLGDATRNGKLIRVLDRFTKDMTGIGFVLEKIAYRSTHYGTGKYAYQHRADYHGNGEGTKKDATLIFRKP